MDGIYVCIDLRQFVWREMDRGRAEILLHMRDFRGAGDRHDPWLLGQQPG
nr:hypothetical protein [Komagataeibacter europaeus]